MNIFLIDYENVNMNGLKGIEKVKSSDEVVLFYSINSENIKLDIISTIIRRKISLKLFKLNKSDKNALDFQLATYLGSLISIKGEFDNIVIISKDNGYQSSIDFCNDYYKINIYKYDDIENAIINISSDDSKEKRRLQIEKNLQLNNTLKSNLIENQFKQISAILIDNTKNNKSVVKNHLSKTLGKKKENLIPTILECCKEFVR